MSEPTPRGSAARTPLGRRGLLHGSTHAPDHDDILRVMEEMATTQLWLVIVSSVALVIAVIALFMAVFDA